MWPVRLTCDGGETELHFNGVLGVMRLTESDEDFANRIQRLSTCPRSMPRNI